MGGRFTLGRIVGIEIGIDTSWIIIFLIVTIDLALAVFPVLHPDWSQLLIWGMAGVASILFFASVLTHELAHSIVARARGLPVNQITLFLFGGISNIEEKPQTPKTEFLMALVGPLTSIALGIILILIGGISTNILRGGVVEFGTRFTELGPFTTLLLWLGPINIVLGLFNLIPGFPLDGGRVLRSTIWAITDNFSKATNIAVWSGRLVSWAFIIIGILMILGVQIPVFGAGLFNGIWLIFLGWFLNRAARESA
ncbi:MAG: site-2 protease family protein [Patescibacteria group bacterium]|jgi:Zn-dependent protease